MVASMVSPAMSSRHAAGDIREKCHVRNIVRTDPA
jgi:hypothetical protein